METTVENTITTEETTIFYELKSLAKRKAFSFMEMLVTLVIIVSMSVGTFFAYNEAQHTRKMAQMNQDMDAIVLALTTYETLSMNSSLPATLQEVVSLDASNAIDSTDHDPLLRMNRSTGEFTNPWGTEYTYDASARTLTTIPQDSSGTPMTAVVKNF